MSQIHDHRQTWDQLLSVASSFWDKQLCEEVLLTSTVCIEFLILIMWNVNCNILNFQHNIFVYFTSKYEKLKSLLVLLRWQVIINNEVNWTWLKEQEDLFICGRKAKSEIATEIISFTSYWSVSISSDKVQDRSIAGRGHILTKAALNRVFVNIAQSSFQYLL